MPEAIRLGGTEDQKRRYTVSAPPRPLIVAFCRAFGSAHEFEGIGGERRGRRRGGRSMFLVCGEALYDLFVEEDTSTGVPDRRAHRGLSVQRGGGACPSRAVRRPPHRRIDRSVRGTPREGPEGGGGGDALFSPACPIRPRSRLSLSARVASRAMPSTATRRPIARSPPPVCRTCRTPSHAFTSARSPLSPSPPRAPCSPSRSVSGAGASSRWTPNVRVNVEPDLARWRREVERFARAADLVKLSEEDLGHLDPERSRRASRTPGSTGERGSSY